MRGHNNYHPVLILHITKIGDKKFIFLAKGTQGYKLLEKDRIRVNFNRKDNNSEDYSYFSINYIPMDYNEFGRALKRGSAFLYGEAYENDFEYFLLKVFVGENE